MNTLALSPAATASTFALIGAFGGAIVAGAITLVVEVLRRRWKRSDDLVAEEAARRTSLLNERKAVYAEFLARGLSYRSAVTNPSQLRDYIGGVPIPVEAELLDSLSADFAANLPEMAGLQYLLAKVILVAGPEVSELANMWTTALVASFLAKYYGKEIVDRVNSLTDELTVAMKTECGISIT